jgi:multidrug efflux system outer membrane protein
MGLEGCMIGPDFQQPEMIKPDAWHAKLVGDMEISQDGPGRWWETFNDPVLVELIDRTSRNNLDLRTMVARIDASRAAYGIAAANLFPMVDGTGQAVWYRGDHGVSPVAGVYSPSGDSYALGLQFGWEIDLWGRVRRMTQAQEMSLAASVENWRDMLVTVRAEVASSYISYRMYRARAGLNELAIAAAKIAVEIAEDEYAAGTTPLSSVLSARSQLSIFEAQLPPTEAVAIQSLNQLSILLGETPGSLESLVDQERDIPVPSTDIAVAMPAEVIRQRPDIRSAERRLASEVALIGATEALLLPQFTLTGGIGYQSVGQSSLLEWSNRTWSIGPSMSWSLLNWGQVGNQIRQQQAITDEALIDYQSTILGAFQEVENALVGFASSEVSRQDTASSRDDTLHSLVLTLQSYEAGTIDMVDLVQVELQYLDAEYSLLDLEGQVAQAAVTLYKAMGGDWAPVVPGDDGPMPVNEPDEKSVAVSDGGDAR